MLEWCYQGDPRNLEDHYRRIEGKEKEQNEQTEKELEDLFIKQSLNNEVDADNHVGKRVS